MLWINLTSQHANSKLHWNQLWVNST